MRLSYANVTATLALVFCMAGVAIAGTGSATTSATSSISTVCASGNGTLSLPTSNGKCRNKGRLRKLAGSRGAAGAKGSQGPTGPQGPAGTNGIPGATSTSSTTQLTSPDGQFKIAVSNTGITLSGPGTSLALSQYDITQLAERATTVTAGTNYTQSVGVGMNLSVGAGLSVFSGGALDLEGGTTTTLGGQSGVSILSNATTIVNANRVNLGGTNCTQGTTRGAGANSTTVFTC